ncbi:MAG: hypothetical protein CMJ18_27100 [Phycisphaeraceae bacterium]|nr:hypothetical protein [Phycisphaeraceae bacterium]
MLIEARFHQQTHRPRRSNALLIDRRPRMRSKRTRSRFGRESVLQDENVRRFEKDLTDSKKSAFCASSTHATPWGSAVIEPRSFLTA